MMEARVEAIESRVRKAKDLTASLHETIVNKEAKEFLLRFVSNGLTDIETLLLPYASKASTPYYAAHWLEAAEHRLHDAEDGLKRAQKVIEMFGPDFQVIRG
jgi:hypothetical protein